MRLSARIGAALALALAALAGCGLGQSRLNPLNLFGSDREQEIEAVRTQAAAPIVDQVVSLEIAQTRSGVIVSSVGLPPTQGFWEADLVPVPSDDPSILLLDFRLLPPLGREPAGTQPSREVLAGLVLSTQDLAGIRTIAVQGARNRRLVSR